MGRTTGRELRQRLLRRTRRV